MSPSPPPRPSAATPVSTIDHLAELIRSEFASANARLEALEQNIERRALAEGGPERRKVMLPPVGDPTSASAQQLPRTMSGCSSSAASDVLGEADVEAEPFSSEPSYSGTPDAQRALEQSEPLSPYPFGSSEGKLDTTPTTGTMYDDDELHAMLLELKAAQRSNENENDKKRRGNLVKRRACVWPPDARFMPFWNGLLALLVCLSGVAVPLQLAFEDIFEDAGLAWEIPSYFMDACFITDIFVQFRTGFMQEGTLIMDPRLIARKYIASGWLFLDVLAGFPVLLVIKLSTSEDNSSDDGNELDAVGNLGKATKIFRIVRVMRVLRIFRLMKLNRLFALMEEQLKLNPSLVRLFKLFCIFIFMWHWVGCLWLFISKFEYEDGMVDAANQWVPPSHIANSDEFHQWIYALFWAMAVTLGIGMDIMPYTVPEIIFTVFVSFVGVFMFAFVVGSATSSLATKDAMALQQRNRVETIQHYMRYRKVPSRLQRQVNEYFTYLWTCMHGLSESDVMASLPTSLRRQLAIALNRKLFLKVDLFRKCDTHTIIALAEHLTPSIAVPHEYLVRQGEAVKAIHFISRGRVLVLVRDICAEPATAPPATTSSSTSSPPDAVKPPRPVLRREFTVGRSPRSSRASEGDPESHENSKTSQPRRLSIRLSTSFLPSKPAAVAPLQSYRVQQELGEFDTFGETSFLTRTPSLVSVRATTFCDMMVLTQSAFAEVSRQFPQLSDLVNGRARADWSAALRKSRGLTLGKGLGLGNGNDKMRNAGRKAMLGFAKDTTTTKLGDKTAPRHDSVPAELGGQVKDVGKLIDVLRQKRQGKQLLETGIGERGPEEDKNGSEARRPSENGTGSQEP